MKELKYFSFYRDEKVLAQLNDMLKEGWVPIRECPLPSGGQTYSKPACLILLARDEPEN